MIFPFQLHIYGFLIGIAIMVVLQIVEGVLHKEKIEIDLTVCFMLTLLFGLVGARTYHVVTDWPLYTHTSFMQIIAVWNGGLGIIGAFVGGGIGLFASLWLQKKVQYFWQLLDALGLALPFGQSIGRWGNFFNQELYGRATNLPWGITIDSQHLPNGVDETLRFHPLFLYESILTACIAIFGIWLYRRKRWRIGSGKYFGYYGMTYAIVRFVLEFLRFETAYFPFLTGVSIAQVMMICLFCVSSVIFFRKKFNIL